MTAETMLIVDDDRRICEVVTEFLADQGFEVLCAYDGSEALALLDAHAIAIALVDLLLPGSVSGGGVATRARERGVKVITMSGALSSDRQGRDLNAPHLQKPFKVMELRSQIDRALRSL
ncbi:MAG: response regulator transcription factor [Terriglobia bacterium]